MFPSQQRPKYNVGAGQGFKPLGQQQGSPNGGVGQGSGMGSQMRQPGGGMGQQMGGGMQRPRYRTGMGTPSVSGFQGAPPSSPQGGGSPWGSMQQQGSGMPQSGFSSMPSASGFAGEMAAPPQPQAPMSDNARPVTPPPQSAAPQMMPMSQGSGMANSPAAQGYMGSFVNPAMGAPDQFGMQQAQKRLDDQQGQGQARMGGFGPATQGFGV